MKNKKILERVDIQVCIFVAIIVIVSFIGVYLSNQFVTSKALEQSLNERATAIRDYVNSSFDKSTFEEINRSEDQIKQSYQDMKEELNNVRSIAGIMYLYTAKRNEEGNLIYLIDGYPSNRDDFKKPGDPIEEEIRQDIELALTGQVTMPKKIKDTTWGHIFVCYFPILERGKVVGVLGIEFEAEHQYRALLATRILTPLIAAIVCFFAVIISLKLFRRISNPTFKDFANTDQLTNLKNRNAYEIDMHNAINKNNQAGRAIISMDLNGLKGINDTLGHEVGDEYIRSAARVLEKSVTKNQILYRTGGDEFVIILEASYNSEVESVIEKIQNYIVEENISSKITLSIAMGYAIFDDMIDRDLLETYRRADKQMYEHKNRIRL